jgi:glycosyltransferase involved in cell wall biosynthesis
MIPTPRTTFLYGLRADSVQTVTRSMNIAVDLTPMLPEGDNGGVKFATIEFLKGLQVHLRDQLQFLFLTADDTHDEVTRLLRKRDTAVCVLRRMGKGSFVQTIQLATRSGVLVRDLLRKHRSDVFYCPFGTLFFRASHVPTVVKVADILHREFPFSLPVQTREWRELQFRKLVASVDFFQVDSEFTAERLKSLYQVPSGKIFITRLPIHGRLEVVSAKREPFFFYPANFWVHKNHEILLIAYQIYLAKCADGNPWELVLTGRLDERAGFLQQLIADLGIAAQVRFLGHVTEAELAKLYSTASCLVFPSLHEGFGIPIVEAMSFGLPIICGRDTSIPEIAGNAAFYAEMRNPQKLADALCAIAENETLRRDLAALGKERLKAFDFSFEVRQLAGQFASAARTKRKARRTKSYLKDLKLTGVYYARALARKALKAVVEVPMRLEQMRRSSL